MTHQNVLMATILWTCKCDEHLSLSSVNFSYEKKHTHKCTRTDTYKHTYTSISKNFTAKCSKHINALWLEEIVFELLGLQKSYFHKEVDNKWAKTMQMEASSWARHREHVWEAQGDWYLNDCAFQIYSLKSLKAIRQKNAMIISAFW